MARFTLLILLFISFSVLAENYGVITGYKFASNPTRATFAEACDDVGFNGYPIEFTVINGGCRTTWPDGSIRATEPINTVGYCPGGGSVSGGLCIGAPDCDAGETRNVTTGICTVSCPASGVTKLISVKSEKDARDSDGALIISIDGDPDGTKTAYESGCEYTYTAANFDTDTGCYKSPDDVPDGDGEVPVYCAYTATSTGVQDSNATETAVAASTNSPGSTPVESSENGNCVTDSSGNKLCASTTAGTGCGTVNGTAVCPQATGTGTVDGKPYTVSDKNCGMVNGKPVCVSNDLSSSTTVGCVVNGAVRACVNSDLTESEVKEPSQTLPDGTVVETTTTENNLIGDPGGITTKSTATDGTVTTTKTGSDSTEGKTDCEKNPESLGCKAMGELPQGSDSADIPNETVSITALSPVSVPGGSGSCPADLTGSYLGKSVTFSFAQPCEFASMISPVLIVIAWIGAALIVVGPVRS